MWAIFDLPSGSLLTCVASLPDDPRHKIFQPRDPFPAPAVRIVKSPTPRLHLSTDQHTPPVRPEELMPDQCDFPLVLVRYFCSILTLHVEENKSRTMKEERLASFKLTIRQRINMRRLEVVCAGDKEQARTMVVRGLREIADEIEAEEGKPRVRWDPKLKISVLDMD